MKFLRIPLFGREIPSFFILETRLVLGSPSRTAAPSGPPITQPVSSKVREIRDRAQSLRVPDRELGVVAFCGRTGVSGNTEGSGSVSTALFDRMTARSIRFWSSRMFPGQG